MSVERTPNIANQIGSWTTPRPSHLDLLAHTDPHTALAEATSMLKTYREMTQVTTEQLNRTTDQNRRLQERLRQALDEIDHLVTIIDGLQSQIARLKAAK